MRNLQGEVRLVEGGGTRGIGRRGEPSPRGEVVAIAIQMDSDDEKKKS